MNYTWPSHYPPNCPSDPQTEMAGDYYRMVFYPDRIRKKDFRSAYDRKMKPEMEATCIGESAGVGW